MKRKVAILLRGAVSRNRYGAFISDTNCTHGNYVKFESIEKSIRKHIIEFNSDIADFDFYIHSWNYDLETELLNLYNPVKYKFENNDDYTNELESYKKYIKNVSKFELRKNRKKYLGQMSQALSIKKVIELVEESESSYDQIILYRPDVLLWKDMDLKKYDTDKIYVTGHKGHGGFGGDFHFVMNMRNANKFKNLYDSLHQGNAPPSPHHWIKKYVFDFMKSDLIMDDIIPPHHQEVLRKIKGRPRAAYELGFISEEILKQYDLKLTDL
jgi:hypothetical protein